MKVKCSKCGVELEKGGKYIVCGKCFDKAKETLIPKETERKNVQVNADVRQAASSSDVLLAKDELNLIREWFNVVQDFNDAFLLKKDYKLARKIYKHLGMKPSKSILSK